MADGEQASKQTDLDYLKTHNIPLIFKELVAKLIEDRPQGEEEIKTYLAKEIKMARAMNNKVSFYTEADFEKIFDAFDIFKKDELSIDKVLKILTITKIPFVRETFMTNYKLTSGQMITKKVFLKSIVRKEYPMLSRY